MPHVIIKLYPGRSEEQKNALAASVGKDIVATLGCPERVVSVAIEEVAPEDWPDTVYKPEILDRPEQIYVKPGYNPFDKAK